MRNPSPRTSRPLFILLVLAGALVLPFPAPAGQSALIRFPDPRSAAALVLRGAIPEDPRRGAESPSDRGIGAIVAAGFRPGRPVPFPSSPRVPLPGALPPGGEKPHPADLSSAFPEDVDPSGVDLKGHSIP